MTTRETEGKFYEIVETAKKEGANLLMPSTRIEGLSDWHAPVIERVQLSINPDDNDIYPHDNADEYLDKDKKIPNPKKKWRLTKQALMKLSVCAGIIWSAEHCKRVDNRADRNYICYQAVGGVRKADGSPVFFKGEYDIDFEVLEAELREQYEKKAKYLKKGYGKEERAATDKEKEEYVEFCVKRDMLQKRKHGLKLAEAGAMNRVTREILGLKQAYTQEELKKPFVMVRIVFKPDFNDKEVRAKLIDASIKAMTGIYGGAAMEQAVIESAPIDVTPIEGEGENGDAPNFTEPPEPEPEPEPKPESDPGKKTTTQTVDSVDSRAADFLALGAADQETTLKRMATEKKYDIEGYLVKSKVASVRALKPETRENLFRFLYTKAA